MQTTQNIALDVSGCYFCPVISNAWSFFECICLTSDHVTCACSLPPVVYESVGCLLEECPSQTDSSMLSCVLPVHLRSLGDALGAASAILMDAVPGYVCVYVYVCVICVRVCMAFDHLAATVALLFPMNALFYVCTECFQCLDAISMISCL